MRTEQTKCCQKAEMRVPFVLPRSSSQFSFVARQESEVPCILILSAGRRKASTRSRTGARDVTVASQSADHGHKIMGPFNFSPRPHPRDAFWNPSPTEFHLENAIKP